MATTTRDLRLDFFRGLSLLFIFVDHIPDNLFSYLTLANFVFNDAAEIFVFISGYTAAVVFGAMAARAGALYAVVQVLGRCWTLYVAHIFLFVIFTAQVAYTAEKFENPMFIDEMKVAVFLQEPHIAILKALTLQFQPMFMGILPLYIVLLFGFAAILPVLQRHAAAILAGSFLLYIAVPVFGLHPPTYPGGNWFHNPIAWQFLFVIGAVCAVSAGTGRLDFLKDRWLLRATVAFLVLCVAAKLVLTLDEIFNFLPDVIVEGMWLFLDKTTLGPLRLLNFLALAYVTVRLLPQDSPLLRVAAARPVVLCGQQSLYVFCLGILLSYLGHLILVQISHALAAQFAVSAAGILIMFTAAAFLAWLKGQSRARGRTPEAERKIAARQGGE